MNQPRILVSLQQVIFSVLVCTVILIGLPGATGCELKFIRLTCTVSSKSSYSCQKHIAKIVLQ